MSDRRALTSKELDRFEYRMGLFKRRGLSSDEAETLADKLASRDIDCDDRRVCLECRHIQRDGKCFAAQQGRLHNAPTYYTPVRTMLQRCEGFAWQTPA